jgi:hypothetical protein
MLNCQVCESKDFLKIKYPNANDNLFIDCDVMVCKQCGFGFIDKVIPLEILINYYENNYGKVAKRDVFNSVEFYFSNTQRMYKLSRGLSQINLIKRYIEIDDVSTVLEIGPGLGTFASLLQSMNNTIEYKVIEYEKQSIEHMNYLGINVFSSLESIEDDSTDLLISSHSLEHYQNFELLKVLKEYKGKLTNGGLLFLEVPLVNFIREKLNFDREHEPHTLFFTLDAINELFIKLGFEVLFLNSVGDFYHKNKPLEFFYRIQDKLIRNHIFALEYGGNRICARAVLKKVAENE